MNQISDNIVIISKCVMLKKTGDVMHNTWCPIIL